MKTILYFQFGYRESNKAKAFGVHRYARDAHWKVHVVPYADATSGMDLPSAEACPDVGKLISFWKSAGIIVDCGGRPDMASLKVFRDVPTVFMDQSESQGLPSVFLDDDAVVAAAFRELSTVGCKIFAFVPWLAKTDWSCRREKAFALLVKLNGCTCHVFEPPVDLVGGEAYRDELVAWLRSLPKPCGILAANDYIGNSVLNCAAFARVRVPEEMQVIGVDNDEQICEHTAPTLTSVIPDFERAGYLAAELLDEQMHHSRRRRGAVACGVLSIRRRASTYPYRPKDTRIMRAIELIRKSACDGLRARDVIETIGCSRSLAEQRFREVTGRSILSEIQAVRVERAKYLAAHTDQSVAEIAVNCGYKTTEQLRRLFVEHFGCSPLQWRNS